MEFRKYDKKQDRKAAFRIWLECGWVKDNKEDKKTFDIFTESGRTEVAEVDGKAEALVVLNPGKMRYQNRDLKLTAVSAVTVSRILRKRKAAPRLLASMLRDEMEKGTHLAGLGMFEQGFYNRLGFGTMKYEHWYSFDPGRLKIYKKGKRPVRLTEKDWKECYRCFKERQTGHGFVTIDSGENFHAEMLQPNSFGLGIKKEGKLSHYLWFHGDNISHGPYQVRWMAYNCWDEFLELMGIIKSLEEQVRCVNMREPAHIQLQDFVEKPFRLMGLTEKSHFWSKNEAEAYQQLRICSLEECISAVEYDGPPFSFNLTLTDPLLRYTEGEEFRGCEGDYTVTVGPESKAGRGHGKNLPLVKGTVNGFTRLWIGVMPASTVGLTEEIFIDSELIKPLEKAFYKPYARSDWDY